jgi:hypothetical protein
MLIGPQNSPIDDAVTQNLRRVRAAMAAAADAAGRTVESVTLVAVSKRHAAPQLRAVAACGVRHFGESYLQEAMPKIEALADLRLTWHFIGRIQANKTGQIAARFDWVHGLDRLKLAERLSAQRPHFAPPLQVCLQVNIAGEAGKAGVAPPEVAALGTAIAKLPRLCLRGLMCILPAGLSAAQNRHHFAALHALLLQLSAQGLALDTLSMGMSADFPEAIAEGATLIRVGTAIFGPRSDAQLG